MPRNIWPDLATAKANKVAALTAACAAAITGGFQSSALGSAYLYPTDGNSQLNLTASAAASALPGVDTTTWTTKFRCVPVANKADARWPMVEHTAAQIQQVALDGKAWITAQQDQLDTLIDQVTASATATVPAVLAIQWSDGTP